MSSGGGDETQKQVHLPDRVGAGTPDASRLRALSRDRNFALLWGGEMLSEVGSQVTTIAMPLLVLSLTGSAAKAGLVGVARTVAFPLTSLPVGVLADRVDRRRLMIGCALGRMVAIGSVPLALVLGRPSLSQLLFVSLLDAALFSAASVAERGLLGQIVRADGLADAVTLNEARNAIAVLGGPPVGGALFGLARGLPFTADAISFLAAFLALLRLRVPPRPNRADAAAGRSGGMRAVREQAVEGLRWLWNEPFLRAGSLLYAAANVTLGSVELLGLLIARHHGASSAAIGGAFAIVGAGGLLGAALASPLRRRLSARWAVLTEPWLYALLMPLLLVLHSAPTIGLLIAVMLMPMTLSSSVIVGRRLALTPDRLRSRVQASASFLGSSLSWIGPLAIGLLFQYTGETSAVISLSAWTLATAAGATLAPGLRSVPDVPDRPLEA